MASTTTRLLTFEEFEKLPEAPGMRQELHHGEVIEVPPPQLGHYKIALRLQSFLAKTASDIGIAGMEMGFRPLAGNEYLVADVVFILRKRWDALPGDGYMVGAPELVIEVLSPSNTLAEMRERRKMCLENGGREFWMVDPKLREVEVSTPDGHSITYTPGQQIPLFFAAGSSIAIDAIFE
jgi:Uma2 family endonuclease